jgi:hypothetical protein
MKVTTYASLPDTYGGGLDLPAAQFMERAADNSVNRPVADREAAGGSCSPSQARMRPVSVS